MVAAILSAMGQVLLLLLVMLILLNNLTLRIYTEYPALLPVVKTIVRNLKETCMNV